MSDSAEDTRPAPGAQDELPVDDLIRLTREFTRRITNQDRQRLALDLRASGHQRSIQSTAPIPLQQFFSGEIDLDAELSDRFLHAPLMPHVRFTAQPGAPLRHQATAVFSCQDDSMLMSIDAPTAQGPDASLEFTFSLLGALALRFRLDPLLEADRHLWLDLMRRENGIAFLWTRERWEAPYLIFVVREGFARVYAFSPHGFEAAARMTPDMVQAMVNWLERLWFPDATADHDSAPRPSTDGWERPTMPRRPPTVHPDAPEDQWDGAADASSSTLEW
jgi:hypothetical protein